MQTHNQFLPTTAREVADRGWQQLDIILVAGDSYIDSPYMGTAVIGRLLEREGYKVGLIAQPDTQGATDITRLGEPRLFWGISGGSVDSMVSNYTAQKKKRRQDDFTPGGVNDKRPDRAVVVYSNLIRRYFKDTVPIVLGGIEASLRRITHYDFWSDSVRRPLLFDAKADYLIYGMGERAALQLAARLDKGKPVSSIKGLAYIAPKPVYKYEALPSWEDSASDSQVFLDMFGLFYRNNDPITARGLYQQVGDRYLIQNPPQPDPDQAELDDWADLPFLRDQHPYYEQQGSARALDTIRFSLNTHRGCYGECNFCAIAVHQGRTVVSRSPESILKEARDLTKHSRFKGTILDAGGPTANMYGYECAKKIKHGICDDKRCVFPDTCRTLRPDHEPQRKLLSDLENVPGVKRVFVASGIRYDLIADDRKNGPAWLSQVVSRHTSGQMKIAPEHTDDKVLELMGKPGGKYLEEFRNLFFQHSNDAGKEQYLTCYFIAAHPGSSEAEMKQLKRYASEQLHITPEQVQIFTPTPSTWSTAMYHTGINPFSGEKLFVEKKRGAKQRQKDILTNKPRHVSSR